MTRASSHPTDRRRLRQLTVGVAAAAAIALFALAEGVVGVALFAGVIGLLAWFVLRRTAPVALTAEELDLLRRAEQALSRASDIEEAARELADHAITLLGARSAVVLIEGIGDTVRVSAGPTRSEDVYGSGSRMRLLDDDGVPCGSIAVSVRSDGRAYGPRHERILDALAERVSTTIHQLSLLSEVQAERRKLTELISASSDGIFSVGPDMRVIAWNPAMARITGVPARDAVGEHVTSSFQPVGEDGRVLFGANDPGRAGRPAEAVLVRLADLEEARWLTCSYSPLPDGGYVVVARDETERKKVQDDKDGWIAQVSHELRTPLTPIKGFLHTLSRRDRDLAPADRQRIYEVMLREEQRLEELVNSLLRSTQLDGAGLVVLPEPVDWRQVVSEQVERFRDEQAERTIALEIGNRVDHVLVDRALATSVLANLLSNAEKYTEPSAPVIITVERDGPEVITSVVDHGPGVPRSDRERIFDKFTRLGDHLTRPQQGVGLGLYIARQAVQRLEGRIWVDATPGGGATFRFTLPVCDRPATADGPQATEASDGDRTTGEPSATAGRRRRRQLAAERQIDR